MSEDNHHKSPFVIWLESEIEKRGWTRAEFARRAEMSQAMVSLIMSGKRQAGDEFCLGVAQALGGAVTVESVMRRAGILPSLPLPEDDTIRQIVEIIRYFPYHDRRDVLEFVRFRAASLKTQQSTNG